MNRKIRIMVVEDNQTTQKGLAQFFKNKGYLVDIASTGIEALKKLQKISFDVFFIDIFMPLMNGLELLRRIKKEYPNVIVFIITGHETIDSAIHALKLGASDYLLKPLDPEALITTLEKALEYQKEKNIKPNVLVAREKKFSFRGNLETANFEFTIKGEWLATNFIKLFKCIRNLFTFFIVTEESFLPKAIFCEYDYLEKLWIAIETGLFETSTNSLIVDKIKFSSPGYISFKGLGEPIKELKNFFESLFLIMPNIKKAKAEAELIEKEVKRKDLEIEKSQADNQFKLELKNIEIIQKKMKLFKNLGFQDNQILFILSQLNKDIYNILQLIAENQLFPSNINQND